jgi:hypoxanthine phosphoribosyltransferase
MAASPSSAARRRPKVFLASSSEAANLLDRLAFMVEAEGAAALRWPDAFPAGQFVLEGLIEASRTVDGALILATADDLLSQRGHEAWAPRDNVLVELGIFVSALSRRRAALVVAVDPPRDIRLPSDLAGLVPLTFAPDRPEHLREQLRRWMAQAGFFVPDVHHEERLPSPTGGRYTWDDVVRGTERLQLLMEREGYAPQVVLGLGRSGGIMGGLLASFLGSIPLRVLDLTYSHATNALNVEFARPNLDFPEGAKRVLVIEGATTGGTTPRAAAAFLQQHFPEVEFRFAFLIQSVQSAFRGDYFAYLEYGPLTSLPWHGPLSRTFLTPGASTS